jgi:hypothetical protein
LQTKGLTVVADKLNFCRFLSHFRCVHRGSFFTEMRTTEVRKLLPEAWGMFLQWDVLVLIGWSISGNLHLMAFYN